MDDVLVIGGGVVGLAIARELASARRSGSRGADRRRFASVTLVERHRRLGQETSSRNSGVVHAGLYYPSGSLKAQACVAGREALARYCAARGVPYERTGKLVVAVEEDELPALERLARRGAANGLTGLTLRDRAWLVRHEPTLGALAALDVPMSGRLDVHELLRALRADALAAGVDLALGTEVLGLSSRSQGWELELRDPDGDRSRVRAGIVVNAAGHGASAIAAMSGVDLDAPAADGGSWRTWPWKGQYFALSGGPTPSRPLVYPLPTRGGLGVHLTQDLGGAWLAGPDAEPARDLMDLDVDPGARDDFAASVRRYLPGLDPAALRPGYVGLRPKRNRDGSFADFLVSPGLTGSSAMSIHLVGIESPGLTACLELAAQVARMLSA